LPDFLEAIDLEADEKRPRMLSFAPYGYPLKPSEYVRRQVRVSVEHQQDLVQPTIDRVPEGIIVFSSEFPLVEELQEAVPLYDKQLEGLPQSTRESFFGKSAAELLHL